MNPKAPFISQKVVLPIAIAAFVLPILIIEYPILRFTHGDFAYPIDDTCIHLSIAKNFALHGVWGTYSGQFASAASSILYPLILALLIKLVGAHLWLPFFVNLIAALVLLNVLQKWLFRQGLSPVAQLLVLLGVIFLTPLAPVAISGMEHILQFLFTFLFISSLSAELERSASPTGVKWRLSTPVYIYGLLMVSTRYEGMAILGIGAVVLILHRKVLTAILLFTCSLIPVIIFGLYSVKHGNFFLPNSVLLKSGAPELNFDGLYNFFTHDLYYKLFYSVVGYNTIAVQRALLLLLLSFVVFYTGIRERPAYKYILLLLTAAVFIHLSMTGYARFPRYEAYLVGCTVTVVGMLAAKYGRTLFTWKEPALSVGGKVLSRAGLTSWVAVLTLLFLAFPMLLRSNDAFDQLEEGSYSTYKVLYSAGNFLHRYYNTDAVSVECLGAMSYFSDGKKMDVVGLGDIDVARRIRENRYTIDFLDSLSKKQNVQIAAGTPISTPPELLQRWTKVGTWYLPQSEGGGYITFYAVNPARVADLKQHLIEFQSSLPEGEKVIYY